MLRFLSFIGQKSSLVLLLGLLLVAVLPSVSSMLRPALPFLVALVLGLAIARLDMRIVLTEFADLRKTLTLLGLVLGFMPVTCVILISIWRLLGLAEDTILLLVVFAAAPPLSSSASLSLLMGYNARITLQVTLLATIAMPIIGPACFAIIGVTTNIATLSMALQIAAMIAGGFLIGLAIQRFIGKVAINNNPQAFNGLVTISMIVFLFPLFDGVIVFILQEPIQSLFILILAITLNIGGNLLVRNLCKRITNPQTANALGLMFGNRNVSFYLAVLPLNPLLSIFVAASQIPIYATPSLFKRDTQINLDP